MKRLFLLFALVCMALFGTSAHAAVDTALSGTVTDMGTFWASIYALLVTVVVAGIGLAYVRKLRGR